MIISSHRFLHPPDFRFSILTPLSSRIRFGFQLLAVLILLACNLPVSGQAPVVVPLNHHPAWRDRKPSMLKQGAQPDTVSLPFVDDFSYYSRSSQPDRELWADQHVFINNDYPVQPRSNGVATFDALDADGNVYQNTASTFPADTLTSCPIDLGVSGLENVYLSFFYQPQGNGDYPEPGDSLIVQFKSPVTKKWRTVWNTQGTTVHPFKQVLLPVEDEYLRKGFRFRFVNLVSLEQDPSNPGRKGNADHWHVDYVRLDGNRSENDTATLDVAMIAPVKSLIRGYRSIPWNQLQFAITTKLEPTVAMTYRNNDNLDYFVHRYFTITDVYNGITNDLTPGGSENIEAGEIMTFQQNIINPFESTSVDSALFELKGYIGTAQYDRKVNDTVHFSQFFKNYFARDDGTPETGYGYSYNAYGCAIACRYETFMPDSLQAIKLYFCPTGNHVSSQYRFRIAVWRDDNGRPGEQAYLSTTEYSPEETGRFVRYILGKAVYVTKYYWIGWVQETSGFLNVGFDRNYNDKGNLWYNTGAWQQDTNDGTLMIRPVMGKKKDFPTSTGDPLPATVANTRLKIYPNPASHYLRIELETLETVISRDYSVEIYGATGRLRYRASYTGDDIDVSGFEPGLYVVRLIHRKSGTERVQKLLIDR
jgi:hypothetical protein